MRAGRSRPRFPRALENSAGRSRKITLQDGIWGCRRGWLRALIQGEKGGEEVGVGHGGVPAVGGEDGGVELLVREVEPCRALVVEIRQGALFQRGRAGVVFWHDARIPDGVRPRCDVAGPRAARRAGKFQHLFACPFGRIQPPLAQVVQLAGGLSDYVLLFARVGSGIGKVSKQVVGV